jgi:hypothetical protein
MFQRRFNIFKENVMKKSLIVLMIALAAMAVIGCKSQPKPDPRSSIVGYEGVERPDWVNKPPKSETIKYVVGTGRVQQTETARRGTARADGLAQIAEWKDATVKASIKSYLDESGTTGNTQSLEYFQQAVISRAETNLKGFEEEDYWIDQDRVYHILYTYPKADLAADFQTEATNFQRNEAAAFAEFKANEAFKYLESQMKD